MGTYLLLSARLAAARLDLTTARDLGGQALTRFRASDAPWWKAKAIRLLERAGAADPALVNEVEQIERGLGAIHPTQ